MSELRHLLFFRSTLFDSMFIGLVRFLDGLCSFFFFSGQELKLW